MTLTTEGPSTPRLYIGRTRESGPSSSPSSEQPPVLLCACLAVAIQIESGPICQAAHTSLSTEQGAGVTAITSSQTLASRPGAQEGPSSPGCGRKENHVGAPGNLASGHPQSTQSPCTTPGPRPCAGTPPTTATRHPPWMAHLGNVSAAFLCHPLGASSPAQGTPSGIHDQNLPHCDQPDLLWDPIFWMTHP